MALQNVTQVAHIRMMESYAADYAHPWWASAGGDVEVLYAACGLGADKAVVLLGLFGSVEAAMVIDVAAGEPGAFLPVGAAGFIYGNHTERKGQITTDVSDLPHVSAQFGDTAVFVGLAKNTGISNGIFMSALWEDGGVLHKNVVAFGVEYPAGVYSDQSLSIETAIIKISDTSFYVVYEGWADSLGDYCTVILTVLLDPVTRAMTVVDSVVALHPNAVDVYKYSLYNVSGNTAIWVALDYRIASGGIREMALDLTTGSWIEGPHFASGGASDFNRARWTKMAVPLPDGEAVVFASGSGGFLGGGSFDGWGYQATNGAYGVIDTFGEPGGLWMQQGVGLSNGSAYTVLPKPDLKMFDLVELNFSNGALTSYDTERHQVALHDPSINAPFLIGMFPIGHNRFIVGWGHLDAHPDNYNEQSMSFLIYEAPFAPEFIGGKLIHSMLSFDVMGRG